MKEITRELPQIESGVVDEDEGHKAIMYHLKTLDGVLGEALVHMFDVNPACPSAYLRDMFDEVGEDCLRVYNAFFDHHAEVKEEYSGDEVPWIDTLMFVERLLVLDGHRGMGYGNILLQHAIGEYSPDIVVLEPIPLQFVKQYKVTGLTMNRAEADAKLIEYYKGLGFQEAEDAFMYILP